MGNIREIFEKGISFSEKEIIDRVPIDWDKHSKGILNIAKSLEPNFKINENNKKILKLLLLYFTGNELFSNELEEHTGNKGSLGKGIMLVGGVGSGKTLLFKIFKKYTGMLRVNSFQFYNALEIIDEVNISGINYLDKFNNNHDGIKSNPITCYIDDIAAANEKVKHFGTDHNVIEQLLSIRYNILNRYHKLTHISTNKFPSELADVYGERVIDRLIEMFNIIELDGKSFRK